MIARPQSALPMHVPPLMVNDRKSRPISPSPVSISDSNAPPLPHQIGAVMMFLTIAAGNPADFKLRTHRPFLRRWHGSC